MISDTHDHCTKDFANNTYIIQYDVFALPEKFNMAVTESDLDPEVQKRSITF